MKSFKNNSFGQSFKNAFRGLWKCVKSERNMRVHSVVAVYVLFFSIFMNLSKIEWAIILAVIGVMFTAESLNTAVEKLCDFSCNKRDRRIGFVKDIAAGAVLISTLTTVGVGVVILYKPDEIVSIITFMLENISVLIAFIVISALAVVFVLAGPLGIKKWIHKKYRKKQRNIS